ncbi:hypothetical protein [Luteolibacter sp. LG18]|uniref:hypothetical protein n=1 Tax=Luteolibacter sp. LG18 TaxID=2819286 RepID=UPI002B2E84A4|nr:hypothetical protein llg_23650 [Luteolibacter sp. LG18]
MSSESRRNFVKKSLVASILAAQPTIMAGLVRASGGGDETTTAPETTVDPWETTGATTVDPWETTGPVTTDEGTDTTVDQWETTAVTTEETTEVTTETTDYYTTARKLAILWQKSSWGNAQTITAGEYATADEAVEKLQEKLRQQLLNTNVTSNSGMVDVSGRSREVTVYYQGAGGQWIGLPPGVTQGSNGKWTATVTIPAGTIFTKFYSGSI